MSATVSRITVARLHNRGNFEHSRYEVSVVVGMDADPGAVLRDLEQLLEDLSPTGPYIYLGIAGQRARLAQSDARRAAGTKEEPWDLEERRLAEQAIAEFDAWKAKRETTYARFKELGGTSRDVDVKETWEDEP